MTFIKGSEPIIPWNKGKLVGQKLPLKPEQIWSIRIHLEMAHKAQKALSVWIERAQLRLIDYLFPSCVCTGYHLSTQQYAKIVNGWVESIGLDKSAYCTHSLRRTKASIIYKQTKNLVLPRFYLATQSLKVPFAT